MTDTLGIFSFTPDSILLGISLLFFIIFFFPTKAKKYFGIAAWVFLIAGLFAMLPELIKEGNVIYPVLLIFSLLLLYVCIRRLLKSDSAITDFTKAGGVFCLIYVPFLIIKPLGDWLISTVVFWIRGFFDLTGFTYYMADTTMPGYEPFWNYFFSIDAQTYLTSPVIIPGGFGDQIVLGCTGITAIALLVAFVFIARTSLVKRLIMAVVVSVPIYIINVFRNVFVIEAYFGQWFDWFPELFEGGAYPGFPSYFWSHNVMCEGGAFLVIIIIAVLLFKLAPGLLSSLKEIFDVFVDDIRALFRGRKPA